MAKKKVVKKVKKEENLKKELEDRNLFAFLATFLSIIGFVIALIVKRDDKYVMYYAKQSLVIFILALIAGSLTAMVGWIPIIGWIVSIGLNVLIFIVWILSWVNALSGKQKEIPIVSYWAKKVDL
ncbi:MAG: DUF4870 domain-containing protein [bacterium]